MIDLHLSLIFIVKDLMDFRAKLSIVFQFHIGGLKSGEAGQARSDQFLKAIFFRMREVENREGDGDEMGSCMGGGGAAAYPILHLDKVDPQSTGHILQREVVIVSGGTERTSRKISKSHSKTPCLRIASLEEHPARGGIRGSLSLEAGNENLLPPTLSVALLKGAKLLILYLFSISRILAMTFRSSFTPWLL
jgi:hypothetical protein